MIRPASVTKGVTMSKFIYPAVFTEEKDGGYSVDFPDLEGCFTSGDDLSDALFMAEDVLATTLVYYENQKRSIPAPSPVRKIRVAKNEFVNLVSCDTLKYRRLLHNAAVKKTLSIPEWMDEAATAAGINFSQTLQDALREKLKTV